MKQYQSARAVLMSKS